MLLPDWITQPHAGYVLAAYGLAFVTLGSLAVLTWLARRKSERALSNIKNAQKRHCEEPQATKQSRTRKHGNGKKA